MFFRKIITGNLAWKRKSQSNFCLEFVRKIFFYLFKLSCYLFVFIVFAVWNSIPVNHTFQILFFTTVHALPCPSAYHLVAVHKCCVSRLSNGVRNCSHRCESVSYTHLTLPTK